MPDRSCPLSPHLRSMLRRRVSNYVGHAAARAGNHQAPSLGQSLPQGPAQGTCRLPLVEIRAINSNLPIHVIFPSSHLSSPVELPICSLLIDNGSAVLLDTREVGEKLLLLLLGETCENLVLGFLDDTPELGNGALAFGSNLEQVLLVGLYHAQIAPAEQGME